MGRESDGGRQSSVGQGTTRNVRLYTRGPPCLLYPSDALGLNPGVEGPNLRTGPTFDPGVGGKRRRWSKVPPGGHPTEDPPAGVRREADTDPVSVRDCGRPCPDPPCGSRCRGGRGVSTVGPHRLL